MEIGLLLAPWIGRTAGQAQMAEAMGFGTLLLTDSQNLAPEVWSQLTVAALATKTIKLMPGVSNSVTRDPAVTASAALSLHAESGGRAVIGIGRGDSAVQRVGRATDSLASFERYLTELQAYLRGEAVVRDGFSSRIEWFRSVKHPKVPVHVAATGPKVIELAARVADGVALAVGADPVHVARSIERARAAAKAAGRRPEELRVGAFVTAVAHSDPQLAVDAVRGAAATFARFSAFPGSPIASLPAPLREAAEFLRANYDMRAHTSNAAAHARAMSDAFVGWYAAAGTADHVLARLKGVRDAGADFIYIVSGSADAPREVTRASVKLIASEIVPALKG